MATLWTAAVFVGLCALSNALALPAAPAKATTSSPATKCPDGAFYAFTTQQCFQVNTKNTTFMGAEQACMALGGHLASIHSAFDNMVIVDEMRIAFDANLRFFVGGNDLVENDKWAWMDGTKMDYTDWTNNGYQQNYDCLTIYTSHGQWVRDDCYDSLPSVCTVPRVPA